MWAYSKGETNRVEKLYLYLTRKARKEEEQSCSRQEELQRNEASDGGGVQAVLGAKREHKQSKHKFDRKRESCQSQRTRKKQGEKRAKQ